MISATSLTGLTCTYEDPAAGPGTNGGVLGVVEYSGRVVDPLLRNGRPYMAVPMTGAAGPAFAEVWRTTSEVSAGRYKGLVYAHDGDYLFCCARVPEEARHAPGRVAATRDAYLAAFELIGMLGYPDVVRVWNMVHDINGSGELGGDVYMEFCRGRAAAFEQARVTMARIPAATCVGSHGGGITFYFLASRSAAVTNIENPNQVPAYEYPPKFGLKPPSFARATHLSPAGPYDAGRLFVSGTASIVGCETVHVGDVAGQCATTLDNIATLIGRDNLARYGVEAGLTLRDLDCVKVFVKRAEDLPLVRRVCSGAFSEHADVAYTNVDICRDDLLVEIEAVASTRGRAQA